MARILVVDDDRASGRLVEKYLQRAGYETVVRHDGRAGVEEALSSPPDLVLADVMMPSLDGLGLTRELRASAATRELPVILLSARGDLEDRVNGLDQGATDYLVKPVDRDDLLARVRAALRHKELQDELRQANADLHRLEQSRHELVSMLAHDIRGLLSAVSSAVQMVRLDLDNQPNLAAHRFLDIAERNTDELVDLTTNLLDCYRLDEGRLRPRREEVDLGEVAADVVDRLAGQAAYREITIEVVGDPIERLAADTDLLSRVLLNLLSNAIKFSPRGSTVTLDLASNLTSPNQYRGMAVAVHDEGPGIPAEDAAHLFERFTPLALPGRRPVGSGLGLDFCRRVVALMGGEIWLDRHRRQGSTFAFVLPRYSEAGTQGA